MKRPTIVTALVFGLVFLLPGLATAADYLIDTKGSHAFIQFKIKHLGYSWLYGRFNDFEGTFSYDEEKPEDSKIELVIETASVDSNHAERDKHLREADFLNVEEYPEARFVSTSFVEKGDKQAELIGDLTLNGVTKPVTIAVEHIGHGPDPWGGYRRGFFGTTTLKLADFNINYDLGPASTEVDLMLSVEGIRQ